MSRKSCISFFLVLVLSCSFVLPSKAAEQLDNQLGGIVVFTFEDGSYLVEKPSVVLQRTSTTVTASKTYNCINEDGVTEWSAKLTGTFTYNGSTSYCTASSCTTTVYSGNWHEAVNNASYAGNAAFASVTMELKFLFIVIKTQNVSLTLTCDANGNLS